MHSLPLGQSLVAWQMLPQPSLWPQLAVPVGQLGSQHRLVLKQVAPLVAHPHIPPQVSVMLHTPPSQVGVQQVPSKQVVPLAQVPVQVPPQVSLPPAHLPSQLGWPHLPAQSGVQHAKLVLVPCWTHSAPAVVQPWHTPPQPFDSPQILSAQSGLQQTFCTQL